MVAGLCLCVSCAHYTPRPLGYFRIELPPPSYRLLVADGLPCRFHVSALAVAERPSENAPGGWVHLFYPSLDARIYCSYFPVTPSTLGAALGESRALVARQSKDVRRITEQVYRDPERKVYASLYESDVSASPVQFTLTDSAANFFRGALLYSGVFNADSLAPVTHYLKADVMELIRSFSWREE
jgi:gliding motility-associated lipoprotein GldD